jgi:hypothetical protein
MSRILSLTCAAGLVALLAACSSTLESNALSPEVGSGTSTLGAKARLGPGMWPMPKVIAANSSGRPAPGQPQQIAGR